MMIFSRKTGQLTLLAVLLAISACGTTYQVTELSDAHQARAAALFAQERNPRTTTTGKQLSPKQAINQFNMVVQKVEPVAEDFCRQNSQDRPNFNCDIQVRVDARARERNAYQTYDSKNRPFVVFTG